MGSDLFIKYGMTLLRLSEMDFAKNGAISSLIWLFDSGSEMRFVNRGAKDRCNVVVLISSRSIQWNIERCRRTKFQR